MISLPPIVIDYTNYRGERRLRHVQPVAINALWFGHHPYHEGPQYFLKAKDLESGLVRDFAVKDIHKFDVEEVPSVPPAVTPKVIDAEWRDPSLTHG